MKRVLMHMIQLDESKHTFFASAVMEDDEEFLFSLLKRPNGLWDWSACTLNWKYTIVYHENEYHLRFMQDSGMFMVGRDLNVLKKKWAEAMTPSMLPGYAEQVENLKTTYL